MTHTMSGSTKQESLRNEMSAAARPKQITVFFHWLDHSLVRTLNVEGTDCR
jgi:hypothetical protein